MSIFIWILSILILLFLLFLWGNIALVMVLIFINITRKGNREERTIIEILIENAQKQKSKQWAAFGIGILSWFATSIVLGEWTTSVLEVIPSQHTEAFISVTASELHLLDEKGSVYIIDRGKMTGVGHDHTFARGVTLDFEITNKATSSGSIQIQDISVIEVEDPDPDDFASIKYPWGYTGSNSFTRIAEPVPPPTEASSLSLPLRDTFVMIVAPSTSGFDDYIYAWFRRGSFSQKEFPQGISHLQPSDDDPIGKRSVYNRWILVGEDNRLGPDETRYFTGNLALARRGEFNFRLEVDYKADTRTNLLTGIPLYLVRFLNRQFTPFALLSEKDTYSAQTTEYFTILAKPDLETPPPTFGWLPASISDAEISDLKEALLEDDIKQVIGTFRSGGTPINSGSPLIIELDFDLIGALEDFVQSETPSTSREMIDYLQRHPEYLDRFGLSQSFQEFSLESQLETINNLNLWNIP